MYEKGFLTGGSITKDGPSKGDGMGSRVEGVYPGMGSNWAGTQGPWRPWGGGGNPKIHL